MSKAELQRIADWLRNEMEYTHAHTDYIENELLMLKGGLDFLIGQLEAGKVPAIRATTEEPR